MVASVDPWAGRVLGGRYRLLAALGAGGAGAVYEAEQVGLGRRVAVKLMRPELAADVTHLERFRREARAAAQLGHPHIAQLFDFAEARGGEPAYLVLELVAGRSLYQLLRREAPLSPERAVALAAQILSALATAHAAGIVHRDMKPGNVVVAEVPGLGEVAKVLDFGIARMIESETYQRLTRTGIVMGTPRYMSPEQASGRLVDGRTDLWAVGVILFAALTGRFPFDGSPAELVTAIMGAPVPPMPPELGVPPALEAAIARALEKQVDARYPDANAMADALRAAFGDGASASGAARTFMPVAARGQPGEGHPPVPGQATGALAAWGAPSAPGDPTGARAMGSAGAAAPSGSFPASPPWPGAPGPASPAASASWPGAAGPASSAASASWPGGRAPASIAPPAPTVPSSILPRTVSTRAVLLGLAALGLLVALGLSTFGAVFLITTGRGPGAAGVPGVPGSPALTIAGDAPTRGSSAAFLEDATRRAAARAPGARLGMYTGFAIDPATGAADATAGPAWSFVFVVPGSPSISLAYAPGAGSYPLESEVAVPIVALGIPPPDSAEIAAEAARACPALLRERGVAISVIGAVAGPTISESSVSTGASWVGRIGAGGRVETSSVAGCR